MPVDLRDRADAERPAQATPTPGASDADGSADGDGDDGPMASAHVASSTTRRVIRGALILLSTQPVTWAASLLLVIFVPRLLDSRALGEYQMAVSLEGMLIGLLSLGVPSLLTRRIAAHPESARRDISTALALLVGLGTLGSIVVVLLVSATGLLPISTPLLALVLVVMVLTQFQSVLHSALTGFQRMGGFAWSNTATAVSTSVLALLFISLGGGNLGYVAGGLVPLLFITTFFWRRLGVSFDRAALSRSAVLGMASAGLPFLGWDLLVRLRTEGEALILGAILSVEAAGWWAAAMRVVTIPIFVPTLIVTPLMPALASIRADREAFTQMLRRSFQLTVLVTTGVSAAIAGFAPLVPTTLGWPDEYLAAVPVIQLMSPVLVLVSVSMMQGTGLIALGQERRWLAVSGIATVLQYVMVFVAIPVTQDLFGNGTIGAATGRIVSELTMMVGAHRLLPRAMFGFGAWLYLLRVGVVGAMSAFAVLQVVGTSLVLGGVVGLLAYGVGVLVVGAVRPADLMTALEMARGAFNQRLSRQR